MRRTVRALVPTTFAAIVVSLLIYARQSSADTYAEGPPNGGYEPDDKSHWGCWELGGSTIPGPLYEFFWEDSSTYGLTPLWHSACESRTDMWLRDDLVDNSPPIVLGSYSCLSFWNNGECDRSRITVNDGWYSANSSDWYCEMYHDWCHEIGHSLGLKHSSNTGCLRSGMLNGCGSGSDGIYEGHHQDHITDDITN